MCVSKVSNETLKNLVVEYQKTSDSDLLSLILKKVDRLVFHVIHRLRKSGTYYYLRSESISDLYQTGIVGVYRSLFRIPQDESPEKIPAWFVSYIKNEIITSYPRPRPVLLSHLEEVWNPDEDDVLRSCSSECLNGVFQRMIASGAVSEDEINLLCSHWIYRDTIEDIARSSGVCADTISSKIRNILLRIQREVRVEDLSPEDCILGC